MLVTVHDVTVTDTNPDGTSDYGEFEVGGCLRVDDRLFTDVDSATYGYRTLGVAFGSLTGVLVYTYENTKILPRDEVDLIVVAR